MEFQHLSQFELRQICNFMTLVQSENNFSKAAEHLGIKQPPFSQSIQALEKLLSNERIGLEVELFNRKKRPVELTEAGRVFLIEAQQALFHLDRAVAHARQASRGEIGRLIVGINNSIANTILPKMLKIFQARFPHVKIEILEVTIEQEVPMLKNHQVDVIFQRSPSFERMNPALFRFQTILEEYFVVALPATHPLADREMIPIEALADDFIILPSVDLFPFYEKVFALCHQAGFTPKIDKSINVSGAVALLSLVAAGFGVSIVPNHVKTLERQGVKYRALEYRSLDRTPLNRQIAVVWREDDLSVILHQFIDVVINLPLEDCW
jgi:DNA-binding transcriptional LysR family regulator